MTPDFITACYELLAGAFSFPSIYKIWKNKSTAGVHWVTVFFFWTWGVWNLYYYPHLDQWLAFSGGLFILLVNTLWLYMIWRFRNE